MINLYAAQHLANDHLDVLVVDIHTLLFVDLLDLIDHVLSDSVPALHTEDVLGVPGSVCKLCTGPDIVAGRY